MKIEVGKYYRTRDGRKIGPMRLDQGNPSKYLDCLVNGDTRSFYMDGTRASQSAPELTIVAEWDDRFVDGGAASDDANLEKLVHLTSDEMPNTGRRLLNFDGEIERLVDRKAAEAIAAAAYLAGPFTSGIREGATRVAAAQAPSSPSCTCRSLLHGHENACPFARDVR